MEVIKTSFQDKKDIFNATQGGMTLESMKGNVIDVVGFVLYEREDEEGEMTKFVTFKLSDGSFIGGKSKTVLKSLDAYLETFGEVFPASFEIISGKSKGGRDFIQLALV